MISCLVLGLRVSYDRLLQIIASLANGISDRFDLTKGICPPSLHTGLFTTAAVDNIDHNPGSTTAADSFHGTAISLVQHTSTVEEAVAVAVAFDCSDFTQCVKTVKPLPSSYSNLPPCGPIRKDCIVLNVKFSLSVDSQHNSRRNGNGVFLVE